MKPFLLLVALLTALPLDAEEPVPPTPLLVVSGFEPFGGRTENASWVTAEAMALSAGEKARAVKVPVIWGAPIKSIAAIQPAPKAWVAFGEGTQTFQIEIVADNKRAPYKDNDRAKPTDSHIIPGGAPKLVNKVDAKALATALSSKGFPTHVSEDAGDYLCEEMLYCLLHIQRGSANGPSLVLFIHVPVLGSRIPNGTPIPILVDDALLAKFGDAVLKEVLPLIPSGAAQ